MKQENMEQIERYLRGEMSETEQMAFLEATRQNPDLADELAFQKQLFRELGDQSKQQFVAQLETLSDVFFGTPSVKVSPSGGKYLLPILAAGLLTALLGWYMLGKKANSLASAETTQPESNDIAMVEQPPVIASDPSTVTSPPVPVATTTAPPEKTPEALTKQPAVPTSVNAIDFAPNTYWESLASRKLVGADREISANARLSGGKTLTFKVNMKWPEGETPGPMIVSFYSNKDEDRIADAPIKRITLELLSQLSSDPDNTGKKSYSLSYSAGVNWKPGLYYYEISFENEDKALLVGKFR